MKQYLVTEAAFGVIFFVLCLMYGMRFLLSSVQTTVFIETLFFVQLIVSGFIFISLILKMCYEMFTQ